LESTKEREYLKCFFNLIRFALTRDGEAEQENEYVDQTVLEKIWHISSKHRLSHLIYIALVTNGLLNKEMPLYSRFRGSFLTSLVHTEKVEATTKQITALFVDEKIDFIVLKGGVLRSLYPETWMRNSCDIDILVKKEDLNLTLFLRNAHRLRNTDVSKCHIIEGDVLNSRQLSEAIAGQDIVYVNLAGDLEQMAKNIVKTMDEKKVRKIIFISSIGIYDSPLKPVLIPYRKAADVIEASNLDYTLLRPTWFTNADEVDYETTRKGEPEKGSVISQKSLATLITRIIESPEKYTRQNLGVNKPNS